MESIKVLNLDFRGISNIVQTLKAVQYDDGRAVRVMLSGTEGNISKVRIYCQKPSGMETYTDGTVVNDYCVLFGLTPQMLAEEGVVKSQLQLMDGEHVVTSFDFQIQVSKNRIASSSITSSNEYQALVEAMKNVDKTEADISQNRSEISKIKERVDTAEQNIDVHTAQIAEMQKIPEGGTTADAALNDIKIGYDGTEYQTPGEAVREQISSISELNCYNVFKSIFNAFREENPGHYVPQLNFKKYKRTHNGVTFMWNINFTSCEISGIATDDAFCNMYYNQSELPLLFERGKEKEFKINITGSGVYLYIGINIKGSTSSKYVYKITENTKIIIPEDAYGMYIRLKVDAGESAGANVSNIYISSTMTNENIADKINNHFPVYNKPLLTIIDDDGNKHFLADVVPLIEDIKKPIASAVVPTRIGSDVNYMTYDQIAECVDRGAEILCHTYNHREGSEIPSLDEETIVYEYQRGFNILARKGFPSCDILVYSSSTGNYEICHKSAEKVFKCGIKIGGSVVNNQNSNKYALARYRIDYASTEERTDWNLDDMKAFIDDCVRSGGWMIWMFHTSNSKYLHRVVCDDQGNPIFESDGSPMLMYESGQPVYDRNEVGFMYHHVGDVVYIPMLREAMEYALSKGVDIVTAQYAYKKYFGGN